MVSIGKILCIGLLGKSACMNKDGASKGSSTLQIMPHLARTLVCAGDRGWLDECSSCMLHGPDRLSKTDNPHSLVDC